MKIIFNEADVDKILRKSSVSKSIKIDKNFTSNVMNRIRNDITIEMNCTVNDTVSENIYLKFVLGSSFVAAASILLAIGIITQSTFTFEEYVLADYIMNVI